MLHLLKTPLFLYFLLLWVWWLPGRPEGGRPMLACDPKERLTESFPFCRESLGMKERVGDLIGRLTLPEKITLLVNKAAAVPLLGITSYEWWSEALHGVSDVGPGVRFVGLFPAATSFPQVITTAASFNSTLWEEIGRVVSDEARAMYNGGVAGLTFWSPNVNIFRDPRWGRGQETPGEDPLLAGRYAARYVRGLQGYGSGNRLKVAACCKHYTAYDLDNWGGVDRFHFNAKVHERDLEDTYNAPFEECVVEGKVAGVMCSYNQVNGKPTCADPYLLGNTLRKKWRLNGYIVSDCDSIEVMYDNQHYTKTPEEAAAKALKAGLDLDCGSFLALHTERAVERGLLTEAHINRALAHTIRVQMRLGLFDGQTSQPYSYLGPQHVCTSAHRRLAQDAARQGIVLLLNRGSALPLSRHHRTLAVVGPNSDATITMIGNYAGKACGYVSPVDGIRRYASVLHRQGCATVACDRVEEFAAAEAAARAADATILVMGLDQSVESEGKDRLGLLLPGQQQELITRVAKASMGPTILVLMCGGPVDVSFATNDPRIHAILWVGYPGEAGGAALADILFGKFCPEGRLPMTWYPQSYVEKIPMTMMGMRANPRLGYPGRTHRFYRGPVVFPFGHGLSYTIFIHHVHAPESILMQVPYTNSTVPYEGVTISHEHCINISMVVKVDVVNSGGVDGSHVVLLFWEPPSGYWSATGRMVGFEKVFAAKGMVERVTMIVDVCKHMNVIDRVGERRIPVGGHVLRVGEIEKVVRFDVINT